MKPTLRGGTMRLQRAIWTKALKTAAGDMQRVETESPHMNRRPWGAVVALTLTLPLIIATVSGGSAGPNGTFGGATVRHKDPAMKADLPPTSESEPRTAAQAFKNIQVLKDMPADRLVPTMNFISASLNVGCGYCHVDGPDFEKDDKQAKAVARTMIQMQLNINENNFSRNIEVNCYTCHRGSPHPGSARPPIVVPAATEAPSPNSVSADIVMQKYVEAIGGVNAVQRLSSMIESGTYSYELVNGGRPVKYEVFAKAPAKRLEMYYANDVPVITAYDGTTGWTRPRNGPAVEMSPDAAEFFRYFAEFQGPARLKEIFTNFTVAPPESIGKSRVTTLLARERGRQPVKFYFDQQYGLLLRLIRYSETPLGPNPVQVDYADYRDVDGVRIPFRRTYTQAGSAYTIQLDRVQLNSPIEDGKFNKQSY